MTLRITFGMCHHGKSSSSVSFRCQVDVLVEDEEGNFLVFQQHNYGLKATSLAVVSRHLSPFEAALKGGKAELLSEMQRVSDNWIELGEYRGDANRGAGLVTCLLARHSKSTSQQPAVSQDLETKELVVLSPQALKDALLSNKFLEVKWAATAALGLLQLQGSD